MMMMMHIIIIYPLGGKFYVGIRYFDPARRSLHRFTMTHVRATHSKNPGLHIGHRATSFGCSCH